jgi:hypothetical protein
MHCTYDVTLRRVRATIVAVEKQQIFDIPSVCVFVVLCIRREMRMPHIAICGLFSSTLFFHIIFQTTRFSIKSIGHKKCILYSQQICLKRFSLYEILIEI